MTIAHRLLFIQLLQSQKANTLSYSYRFEQLQRHTTELIISLIRLISILLNNFSDRLITVLRSCTLWC